MELATGPGPTVCQFCRRIFDTTAAKAVHATLAHPDDDVLRFAACRSCGERVFEGLTCPCRAEKLAEPS